LAWETYINIVKASGKQKQQQNKSNLQLSIYKCTIADILQTKLQYCNQMSKYEYLKYTLKELNIYKLKKKGYKKYKNKYKSTKI